MSSLSNTLWYCNGVGSIVIGEDHIFFIVRTYVLIDGVRDTAHRLIYDLHIFLRKKETPLNDILMSNNCLVSFTQKDSIEHNS